MDPLTYDHVIVSFSGGKDSMACLLHVLELGVPRDRIELWHMLVDGRGEEHFMDWPVTESYCHEVAQHFGVPIHFAWKEGGFRREMLRDGTPTAPTHWEVPGGGTASTGGRGPAGKRMKYPQVSADLSVRWCSAYLKVDVCDKMIKGQARFIGERTLLVTGERGEESTNRAGYAIEEPDRTDNRNGKNRRHVDHWRPVRDWPEADVWSIMERWKVRPHPAYQMGFGRVSCAGCIFGNKHQWASAYAVVQDQVQAIADHEHDFGFTIKRHHSVPDLITAGTRYAGITPELAALARSTSYPLPIIMDPWGLPAGAFGDGCGPG
jgi:3'-phosphoadenosine 5'-phosphosulfate sulfotransferase (PAPS reductase)/FAD synthetase